VLGRLGFAGRLMAIVLLALLVMQAIATGIGYMSRMRQGPGEALMLLPERAAAIVDLIEATGKERRESLLRALSSDTLHVAYSAERPAIDSDAQRLPAVEWVVEQYLPEAGGREVVAFIKPEQGARWRQLRIGQYWLASREPLRIAIGLEGGGYAVLESRGDIAPKVFGFPPGFFIGALGALVGIAALLAIWREARPLRELADSVAGFTGEAAAPVRSRGAPEIKKLIAAVNDMQGRIAALVKGRTILLGAISHDLKTYITRLRLRAETIEDDERRTRTARDLDEMAALIDDALTIARGGSVSDRRERVELRELIHTEIADRPGETITLREAPDTAGLAVMGDPVALRRLFANVIDNALRYGTGAEVGLARRDDMIEVRIDDNGPGIPEAERQAVFEPFYRLEQSRSRETGGSGLGLAIARQIVDAHGGAIAIAASPQGGARIVVSLPAA
jgi:two-component system, OmpR family, osmolarity sensor histidine kinase EnvZ